MYHSNAAFVCDTIRENKYLRCDVSKIMSQDEKSFCFTCTAKQYDYQHNIPPQLINNFTFLTKANFSLNIKLAEYKLRFCKIIFFCPKKCVVTILKDVIGHTFELMHNSRNVFCHELGWTATIKLKQSFPAYFH